MSPLTRLTGKPNAEQIHARFADKIRQQTRRSGEKKSSRLVVMAMPAAPKMSAVRKTYQATPGGDGQ
ncbi:MAG: hypothetical protein IPK32_06920 [Verrucomicrobiaceae bacterium]|nr:hypothetical protein [Verrucomicrobiaceae bacterium]